MATAQRDHTFVQEVQNDYPHADATVMVNYEAREAYLDKIVECFQYREALPKPYVSTVYNAFIVRKGSGAGIYKSFCNIPACLSSEEYSGIIPFRTCYEAECWWKDITKEKRKRKKLQRQGPRQHTKYEMLCKTAEQGFTDKVQDYGSGDQNPDKVRNFLVNYP